MKNRSAYMPLTFLAKAMRAAVKSEQVTFDPREAANATSQTDR